MNSGIAAREIGGVFRTGCPFRGVDAVEADTFRACVVQDFEGVAVEGPDSSPLTQDLRFEIRAKALAASGTLSAKESQHSSVKFSSTSMGQRIMDLSKLSLTYTIQTGVLVA